MPTKIVAMSKSRMFSKEVRVLEEDENVQTVIEEIIESGQRDPFYVGDISDIIWKYNNWKKIMPRIQPFYAVKCNNSRIVLETLAAIGCNFDCASAEEISTVLSLGVRPDRIIFANPTKKDTHIKYAADARVEAMTFDCVDELQKIKKNHPDARLLLRISHDDETASFKFGRKYGVCSESEAGHLLSVARLLDLKVIGVCFHVGSFCNDISTYEGAIASAKKMFHLGAKLGHKFTTLDIGGGYPGHKGSSVEKIGLIINAALDKYFPDKSVCIISEPGRYFVESAFTLLTQINTKKIVQEFDAVEECRELIMYYLDVGSFNSLYMTKHVDGFKIRPFVNGVGKRKEFPSIVWGPTCTSLDIVSQGIENLPDMVTGEWVVYDDAGGYTLSLACDFNGFAKPKTHVVVKKQDRLFLENLVCSSKLLKEKQCIAAWD